MDTAFKENVKYRKKVLISSIQESCDSIKSSNLRLTGLEIEKGELQLEYYLHSNMVYLSSFSGIYLNREYTHNYFYIVLFFKKFYFDLIQPSTIQVGTTIPGTLGSDVVDVKKSIIHGHIQRLYS